MLGSARPLSTSGGGRLVISRAALCWLAGVILLSSPSAFADGGTLWKDDPNLGVVVSSPIAHDLDPDENNGLDVVLACLDGKAHAFKGDGQGEVEGWGGDWTWLGNKTWICDAGWPTGAIGDINFDGKAEVVFGSFYSTPGPPTTCVFAFWPQWNSEDEDMWVPGWPQSTGFPFKNSTLVGDANLDGSTDVNAVDLSCYWFMWDGVGTLLQEGLVGDPDVVPLSSPGLADVGSPRPAPGFGPDGPGPPPVPITDLMPDLAVGSDYTPDQLWAFSTVYSAPGGDGRSIVGYPKGTVEALAFDSSPALLDLNGDGAHEPVIGCDDGKVRWYLLDYTEPYDVVVYDRRAFGVAQLAPPWYSSPALADLDGGGLDFVIGGDDGYLYAYHLDADDPSPVAGWVTGEDPGVYLTGAAISSSPVIADIDNDGHLECVVGADDGFVYAVDDSGGIERSWDCTEGGGSSSAIASTPLITDLDQDGSCEIVVANGHGVWMLWCGNNRGDVDWNPNNAPWPCFRGNEGRTGCLPPAKVSPIRGSIGVRITDNQGWPDMGRHPGVKIDDELVWHATVEDGRYIFDMLTIGWHTVWAHYDDCDDQHQAVCVTRGQQSVVSFDFGGQ